MFGLVNTGPVSPSTDLLMMYRVCSVQIEYVQLPDRYDRTELSRFVQLPDRYDRTELSRFGSMGTELTRFGSTGTEFGSVQAERSVSTARFGPNGNTSS